jgi:ring-1,2-phenylacetyl-CoA epoxidase subunit PaaB
VTQWPRFEVFEQERPGRPHQNAGSVHAPDAEMALQNARDVFVRRPSCASLWVAPAEAIFSRTAEEIAAEPCWAGEPEPAADGPDELYYLFLKSSQRRAMTFVHFAGELMAGSAEQALWRALRQWGPDAAFVWWLCPARAILQSDPADAPAMFGPAEERDYRMPHDFHVARPSRARKGPDPGQ